MEAVNWGIDGLSNMWGQEVFPEMMKFVVLLTRNDFGRMPRPANTAVLDNSLWIETT